MRFTIILIVIEANAKLRTIIAAAVRQARKWEKLLINHFGISNLKWEYR